MSTIEKQRISSIRKVFEKHPCESALLLSSAPEPVRSRDTFFPYRQDSDLYYLSASPGKDLVLLISSKSKRPMLFAPKTDPVKIIWEGKPPPYREAAESIGADLIICDHPSKEAKRHLMGIHTLYYSNVPGSASQKIGEQILGVPSHLRGGLPAVLAHSDEIMEPLRRYKDRGETNKMKRAAKITNTALHKVLPLIHPGSSEYAIAYGIDYQIRMLGGELAFNTIAACGPSAAILHYEHYTRKLKRGEMLLIDCGAAYQMYNSDITRVVPVSGKFSDLQKEIYSVVLDAQKAAIKKVKAGALVGDVYDAAAREITSGLVSLGVLRGKVSKLMARKAYKPFFMHGIGHGLGIDVHDIGSIRGNNKAKLEAGMVITIEPGIYFPKKIGKVPACGVRIEDDVWVTSRGCEILSAGFPKEITEIERLMAR